MTAINPQKIEGRWRAGIALDFHTISSTPVGYNEFGQMQFDTKRTEIAELLYQLKYRQDQASAQVIVVAAAAYLAPHRQHFDLLVPVPPSASRVVQPVLILANGIGAAVELPVLPCITPTRATSQLKGITDPEQRKQLLEGLYAVNITHTKSKRILLFDDLVRSGATMNAITDVLLGEGQAASVDAFTITRTRSNQ